METIKPKHIWHNNDNWAEELNCLREIIAQTELKETTKWGGPVFVLNNKNVLGIDGFKNYFTIWFYNGVFLNDPKKVLVNAQEGVTKALRQWRFNSKKEIDENLVLSYILEAIENEKNGKTIKPTAKKSIIASELHNELENNSVLKAAFLKFSAAKQREFHEYIEEAKREATKFSRIEKIKPMILNHIGLNDKYK